MSNPQSPVVVEPGMDSLNYPASRCVVTGLLLLPNLTNVRHVAEVQDPLLAVDVSLVEAAVFWWPCGVVSMVTSCCDDNLNGR